MKPKTYISCLSFLALAATASADVTVNLTGSTAFRSATMTAIKAKFDAGNTSGVSYKFAHDKGAGAWGGSNYSIWIGNFPGITGTTTIRCDWTGSVEGIRALALVPGSTAGTDTAPPKYLPTTVLDTTTASSSGAELPSVSTAGATALTSTSDIALSDVNKTSTPYTAYPMSTDAAGVIVFTMMANKGSTLTNVTTQQYRAVFTQGFQPKSMFTGNAADTTNVYAVGRNDGSGTRTTALAETGFGATNIVQQYIALADDGAGALTKLQLVPQGGINSLNGQPGAGQDASNASTVWGQDVAGNGGYNSGGGVKTVMALTGNSVTVYDDQYNEVDSGAHVDLITWIGVGDAATAKTTGAVLCGYNGVALDLAGSGNTLSTADINKIVNGSYTAWGYERMFHTSSVTGDKLTVYNALKSAIPSNLGTAGIATSAMHVSRSADGGLVAPSF